jgi:iron complex outermembrane receptor protein
VKSKILILIGASILILANNAWAEGEEDIKTEFIALEPITITASRIERRLSEVSSSVSVVTESQIKDSNAKSIPDLLKDLEGIYMYDSSGVGTAGRINMRGFWGGMSTHQLILIDGIPQNKGKDKLVDWDLIPLENIERIELYGDNAMSGVINIITKKPSDIPETKISAFYGSFNTQNYKFSTSGASKRIGYRFGVGSKLTDGFRKHCNYENLHLNGKLDYLINDTQNLRLSLGYHEKERGAYPWALSEAQIKEDRRQARPGTENDKSEDKKVDLSITHHWDIGEISNTEGIFYYRYEESESFYTSGSTENSTKEQLGDENTYGLLLRINTSSEILGIEHFFTAGVDIERNDFDYEEYAAPYQIRGNIRSDYGVARDKVGPYIQDEIEIFSPFKLILGLRYDLTEFDFNDRKDGINSKKKKMSKVTPRYGIVYNYGQDSSLYANYAQAFRTPTIGQMFAYGSYSNPDLNPEEAMNYEVGIRHRFNDYLKANVSLYWMKLDNEIWYDYTARKYDNYGETSHKGVEAGLEFKIIEGLTGFANYTYTRAKNESGNYKEKYLTNIPTHKGSFGLKLEAPFGLRANIVLSRVGSSYIDSENSDKLSSYTTVDTKITYEHKWLSVFLAIDNLFDKKYNSYGYKTSSGTKYFNPAPGRTFTFGAEVRF